MAELTEIQDKTVFEGVEVELGFTKSMGEGSYEFLRGDVRWRSALKDGESHAEATDRVYAELEEKLVATIDELDRALGPRGRTSQIHNNKDK